MMGLALAATLGIGVLCGGCPAVAGKLTPLENGVLQATMIVNYSLNCGPPPDAEMLPAAMELLKVVVKSDDADVAASARYAQLATNLMRKSMGNAAWCKQVWSK
jgi:hypothetical protein